jgi:murein DD-endopeptidase MepM/ murein hydrolase activator NlpD
MKLLLVLLAAAPVGLLAQNNQDPSQPLLRTVDLNRGESREVQLADGSKAQLKLLEVQEDRDQPRSAIRQARVKVEVNHQTTTLVSANYRLPVTFGGVQIDCPVTRGYYQNCDPFEDSWGLDKDARIRLWPAGSPWAAPGTFAYPVKQRWFASATQMANEPSFVDGGDAPTGRPIYYHSGLDIGGCEGSVEVVSASAGLVVSAGGQALPEYPDIPFYKRADYDYVYVVDSQGWFYRYAHLKSIDPAIRPGRRVKLGQRIGVLGKEGSSGGWSHLHFDIKARQPSGKWGIQEAYAFLWEAYQRQFSPRLIAVARPHHLIWAGAPAVLDGSLSWSASTRVKSYQWIFSDGTTATGPKVERIYIEPGEYSEILKIVDDQGAVDYDFAVVLVVDKSQKGKFAPTIHASYAPTQDIRPGDPVTFKVRTFHSEPLGETWDFGDGTPSQLVRSGANAPEHAPGGYAATVHRFARPGHYLVRVDHVARNGFKATARLHVTVRE